MDGVTLKTKGGEKRMGNQDGMFNSILALSADEPSELRPSDVYRVVSESKDLGVEVPFITWLLSKDIQPRVRKMLEKNHE